MTYIRVYLKFCEGCGSLWFRAQDSAGVYCGTCAREMNVLPPPRPLHRGGRPRRKTTDRARRRRPAHHGGGAA
jgi:hypothetical protein